MERGAGMAIRGLCIRSAQAGCLLLFLWTCLWAASATAGPPSAKLAELHLWRALPTRHFIELGGESTARYRWEAFAFRPHDPRNSQKVCVAITSARLDGGVLTYSSGSPECGVVGKAVATPVLFARGFAEPTRSAIVVITGTEAVRVSVSTDAGSVLTSTLTTVQGARAHRGRVAGFRYALLVPRKEVSIRQVIGLGPGGTVEFETPGRTSSDLIAVL